MEGTETIKTDKLTREMIRGLEVGVPVSFELPNYSSVLSARVTLAQMRRIMNADIRCLETGENVLTVKRYD